MRTKDLLRYDQTLFRDREVFEFSYVPEQLHHRDAQLRELAELVRGCVHGGRPRSAILRGPPGTGKTTTVRRLFAELGEATRRVVPVYVNCQHDRTQYAVFSCVFEELAGYAPPSTGKHLNDLARGVVKMLEAREAALLVCLDDANYLHEERRLNNLLYRLLRFYEKWDARRTGVFAVSSDMGLDLCAAVDQRVRSVFHPIEVRFPPYSREEIRQILSDRVRQGLYPGVVAAGALDLAVDITAGERDIRVGIDLVRMAAEHAEREGRRTVTRQDVMQVSRTVIAPTLQAKAAGLTEGESLLLCRIAEQAAFGSGEMTAGAVFAAVGERMRIGYTTYHTRLKQLAAAGIIDLPVRTGRGRTREIVLRYDPLQVLSVCGER